MYSIGRVSELTGVSSYTLRYYEKIELLPSPKRSSAGIREYTDSDIRFIRFLHSLKKTGMSLDTIAEFVQDGCILEKINEREVHPTIENRIAILSKHLVEMEEQRKELDQIISLTKEKLSVYREILLQSNGERE